MQASPNFNPGFLHALNRSPNRSLNFDQRDGQVVQWHEQSVALKLRNERSMTWMYLSWHPEAARVTCGSQLKRGAVSEAYTFGAALNRLLNGRILTTATLPIPFERVVQLSFSESLNKERKQDLWCEIMGK